MQRVGAAVRAALWLFKLCWLLASVLRPLVKPENALEQYVACGLRVASRAPPGLLFVVPFWALQRILARGTWFVHSSQLSQL